MPGSHHFRTLTHFPFRNKQPPESLGILYRRLLAFAVAVAVNVAVAVTVNVAVASPIHPQTPVQTHTYSIHSPGTFTKRPDDIRKQFFKNTYIFFNIIK